jgi:hypothetical protein
MPLGNVYRIPIARPPLDLPSDPLPVIPGTPDPILVYPADQEEVSTTFGFPNGTAITFDYLAAGAAVTSTSESHTNPPLRIFLGNGVAGAAVPGSVRFTFRGRTYVDRSGTLVYGVSPTTNVGTLAGSFDYANNTAIVTDYAAGANTVTVHSLLTRPVDPGIGSLFFRTPGSPLREGSFTIRATTLEGVLLTATADINGKITGTQVRGQVDWDTGLVRVVFGTSVVAAGNEGEEWYDADMVDGSGNIWRPTMVDPATVFFGTVIYRAIPADPAIIGIDPVRLPVDGRVVGYQVGGVIIIHHTVAHSVASPVAGTTLDFGRTQVGMVEVFDSTGTPILDTWYDVDLAAGTLEWADPLNLSAYTLPAIVRERIEFATQCADVQITGEIGLQSPLPRDFPEGSMVSAAIAYGDMQGRVTNIFDQATYSAGQWSDVLVGSPAAATYNDTVYPIAVTNESAIDERWAIRFTSGTGVDVIGETTGVVLQTTITGGDIAPINPVSGEPYFTIDEDGWGVGWASNNVLRFNTISASKPIWAARTTRQGEITEATDAVRIQAYGNAH